VGMYLKLLAAKKKAAELSGKDLCSDAAKTSFLEKMSNGDVAKTTDECKSAIFSQCCTECSVQEGSDKQWDACWYSCYENSDEELQKVCKQGTTQKDLWFSPSPTLRVDFMKCNTCNGAMRAGLNICPMASNG